MSLFIRNKHQVRDGNRLPPRFEETPQGLRAYDKLYWELFNKIENYDPVVFVSSFEFGLTPNDERVYDDLAQDKPKKMEDLMKWIEGWCQLNESEAERGMGKGGDCQEHYCSRSSFSDLSCPDPEEAG